MLMESSGFYKLDDIGLVLFANGIHTPDDSYTRANHQRKEYPVQGWRWFDSRTEALLFFGTTEDEQTALSYKVIE